MNKNNILIGKVVHKRLSPIRHKLAYRVFALMLDCDDFSNLSKKTNLLSYNKFNLFSIYDKDHGNGGPIKDFLEEIKNNVITSFQEFLDFFLNEYYPNARKTLGASELPNGNQFYQYKIKQFING